MTLKLNGTTSGSVSLDAPATGSNVSFTLPGSVGTSGQLLSTNGAGVLSFVNGGKILQVVRATDTTNRSTTSTSYVDVTGMSVTITPQKSDNAVLILTFADGVATGSSGSSAYGRLAITDSSNNAISGAQDNRFGTNVATTGAHFAMAVLVAYATPATTSAVTYKLRFQVDSANITLQLRNATTTGQMYAIEVAA